MMQSTKGCIHMMESTYAWKLQMNYYDGKA
jgi:hypothetical protein